MHALEFKTVGLYTLAFVALYFICTKRWTALSSVQPHDQVETDVLTGTRRLAL